MIKLSDLAIIDLRRIRERIAEKDADLAIQKVDEILDRCERLGRFPKMGRPGRDEGTRELSINPWIVVYRQKDKPSEPSVPNDGSEDEPEADIEIIRLWHSRQSR